MKDQAEELRLKLKRAQDDRNETEKPSQDASKNGHATRTLAVVSGKGGVGKSNLSLSFAISLSLKGHKVLLFDMDLGMGNVDILMGRTAQYSIVDFFNGSISLQEAITEGPEGLKYIAGGSGLNQLIGLDNSQINMFTYELDEMLSQFDYCIFDMGAGATQESLKFILSVQDIVVITTPEPTSITDAYAIMKHIHLLDSTIPFYIVANRSQSEKEGQDTYARLAKVLEKFLNRDSTYLGMIPDDRTIQQAVRRQIPFVLYNKKAPASKALLEMSDRFYRRHFENTQKTTSFQFVSKLKQFLFER